MDVYCATCREPWEIHHLLHDLVWEIWDGEDDSSSHLLIQKFLKGSRVSIPPMLRDDLKIYGWSFGRTILCVLECGCCSSNANHCDNQEIESRKMLWLETEALLGNDLDGLASALSSINRF